MADIAPPSRRHDVWRGRCLPRLGARHRRADDGAPPPLSHATDELPAREKQPESSEALGRRPAQILLKIRARDSTSPRDYPRS